MARRHRHLVLLPFLAALLLLPGGAGGSRSALAGLWAPVPPTAVAWAPDGARFATVEAGGTLSVVALDGRVLLSVKSPEGRYEGEPSWSPDGTQLVVVLVPPAGGPGSLAVVDAGNGARHLLVPPVEPDHPVARQGDVRWSPRGDQIAFRLAGRGLALVPADGSGDATPIADGPALVPIWSGDGRRIAFSDGRGTISVLDLRSGTTLRFPGLTTYCFSPDGSRLAYTVGVQSAGALDTDVAEVDLTTGQSRVLWPGGAPLAYAPDGRRLAIRSDRGTSRVVDLSDPLAGSTPLADREVLLSPDWTHYVIAERVTLNQLTALFVHGARNGRLARARLQEWYCEQGCLEGSDGPDVLTGTDARDIILPGAGADRVLARGGNDRVDGTFGNDRIDGGPGEDALLGGAGDDVVLGGAGPDHLQGGPGADQLDGGPGYDFIATGGDRQVDVVRCGPGGDSVQADAYDVVSADCEKVVRDRTPPPLEALQSFDHVRFARGGTAVAFDARTGPGSAPGRQRDVFVGDTGSVIVHGVTDDASASAFVPANAPRTMEDWSFSGDRLALTSEWVMVDGAGRNVTRLLQQASRDGRTARLVGDGFDARYSRGGVLAYATRLDPYGFPTRLESLDQRGRVRVIVRGAAHQPAWSPDGKTLAYTGGFGERTFVHTVRADGSLRRRLAAGASPVWSPDGRRLAYVTTVGNAIATVDAGGGRSSILVRLAYRSDRITRFAWAAGGNRLAYVRSLGLGTGSDGWLVDLRTGARRLLTRQATDVTFSRDGKLVAFGVTDGVLVANADGSHLLLLAFER